MFLIGVKTVAAEGLLPSKKQLKISLEYIGIKRVLAAYTTDGWILKSEDVD